MLYSSLDKEKYEELAMLAVRLPENLEKQLSVLAEKTHRSKSYYVKKALETFLKDREEYLEAVAAYEEYLSSGKKGFTLEEMKQRYGFD